MPTQAAKDSLVDTQAIIQGGNFLSGFLSSFASTYLQPIGRALARGSYYGRAFFSAMVGGTVSVIGGGKFANGAVTSAFQFMFNHALHENKGDKEIIARARRQALRLGTDKIIAAFEKIRNLPLAQRLMLLYKFTKNKSILDFKQEGAIYQDYGNFAFGAVGSALDIDDAILLRGAAWAQIRAGTSKLEWGSPYGWSSPYGDDPHDQEMIESGIEYYRRWYGK